MACPCGIFPCLVSLPKCFFLLGHMLIFHIFEKRSMIGKDNANTGLARSLPGNNFGPGDWETHELRPRLIWLG